MASPSRQRSPMPPAQVPSPMGPPTQSPAPLQSPHSSNNQQHVNGPPPSHGSNMPTGSHQMPMVGPHMSGPPGLAMGASGAHAGPNGQSNMPGAGSPFDYSTSDWSQAA